MTRVTYGPSNCGYANVAHQRGQCPNCGYCPCCGRSDHSVKPSWDYFQPYYNGNSYNPYPTFYEKPWSHWGPDRPR